MSPDLITNPNVVLTQLACCSELEKLDKALRTLHLKPENVKRLVAEDECYTFKDIARALVHRVWPTVSTGDSPIIHLPDVKGGLWIKILQPIGKVFSIGPNSQFVCATLLSPPRNSLTVLAARNAMLSPTDLVDEVVEAFVRTGMNVFPCTVYNGSWHFTYKKWHRVRGWKGPVEDLLASDSSELEVIDAQDPPPEGEDDKEEVRPKRKSKKSRTNPANIDYTQVTNRRDAEIDMWADSLGFEIKDGRISVKKLWQGIMNEYILSLRDKLKKHSNAKEVKRRWERWASYVKPDEDVHRVCPSSLSVCAAATQLTPST